jgi:hypothetical protein
MPDSFAEEDLKDIYLDSKFNIYVRRMGEEIEARQQMGYFEQDQK